MDAYILCVGTELLLGDVVNTNAAEIAKELAKMGINVYHHEVVGDNNQRLKKSLNAAFETCDLVILTGGLGPTYDDLTKETVAQYFGKKLVMDDEYLVVLRAFFEKFGKVMTDNNIKQAMVPEGGTVLPNPNGTAPGCVIEGNGKTAILMPGPPREMRPMLMGPVRDFLVGKTDCVLTSRVLNIFGVGESAVEDRLKDIMIDITNPTIAPYAKTSECQLRVTAKATNEAEGQAIIAPVIKRVEERFAKGEIYAKDCIDLPDALVKILTENGHTIAVAESCTGGLVSSRIVDYKGSSAVLLGSVIAYSNELKQKALGVKSETLENFGAVSKECALEMARGVRALTGATIGVSTTGIAGPGGGGTEKPVGLVYVAVVNETNEIVKQFNLARGRSDDRENIRNMAAAQALYHAIECSKELSGNT